MFFVCSLLVLCNARIDAKNQLKSMKDEARRIQNLLNLGFQGGPKIAFLRYRMKRMRKTWVQECVSKIRVFSKIRDTRL
jgi:hypothetical protein